MEKFNSLLESEKFFTDNDELPPTDLLWSGEPPESQSEDNSVDVEFMFNGYEDAYTFKITNIDNIRKTTEVDSNSECSKCIFAEFCHPFVFYEPNVGTKYCTKDFIRENPGLIEFKNGNLVPKQVEES